MASVHYYNGTVVEVAHVRGNPEYLELMKRLARDSRLSYGRTKKSRYETILSHFSLSDTTAWGAWWRWLNKKLGSPIKAHNDVEIISELLQVLQISTQVSQALDRVAVTTPDLSSISSIINAALEDLDLRTWVGDSDFYPRSLAEANAVFAANGYGLCISYQDLWDCELGFCPPSFSQVFTIFYSRHLLYTSIMISGQALARWTYDDAQLLNFDLGLDNLLQTKGSQDSLWPRLRSQIIGPSSNLLAFYYTHFSGRGECNPPTLSSYF
ncbi:hypothetical protein N7520_004953 [Penicillium odoratum]|uniref:uncharacterized protein n=1 Tax=Penicillium odoratum TaxID=1167516 RepID=UPI002549754F|nr:uncharacterized protein N7520_004953 [Penicillium odoratum]KAJ5765394.1 hypothetical protein N7520_004953 [Penicillium odoratum]